MFRIGEFSKLGKTTVKTLRFYDEIGLLEPEETDPFTGYRLYSTRQLVLLHRIHAYRQCGLSIGEIKLVLAGQDAGPILQSRKAELMSELADRQDCLSRIEFILKGEDNMDYTASVKELPACTVYTKRMTVPNYDAYFDLIPAIGQQMGKQYPDLKCTVPEYCFIMYLDGEYRETNINIEFCESVTEMRPDFDDITFRKMPAATAVSVLHKGAYAGLRNAYAFVFKWIEENGYTVAGNPRESYIDGVWNKDDEADWLTELQVPVAKGAG